MSHLDRTYAQALKSSSHNFFELNSKNQQLENENASLEIKLKDLQKKCESLENENFGLKKSQRYCAICHDNVPDTKSVITFGCCKNTLRCKCSMNYYYQCTDTHKTCPLCKQSNDYGETHFEKSKEKIRHLYDSLMNMKKISRDLNAVYQTVKIAWKNDVIV